MTSLGAGRYEVRLWWTCPKTGRSRKAVRILKARSVADAARQREELRTELSASAPARERVRVATFAESWLRRKLAAWKASTATQNASALEVRVLPALGDYYLDAVTSADVVAWRDGMVSTPYREAIDDEPARYPSAASVNSRLRLLRQLLGDAAAEHDIPNPAARVEPLRVGYVDAGERDHYLDVGEARALLGWFRNESPRWYPLVAVLAQTGLRFGEATALRWSDVDLEGGWLEVHRAHVRGVVDSAKSAAGRRRVPIGPELAATLRAHQAATGRVGGAWVFLGRAGNLLSPSVLSKPTRRACEALGLPWRRVPAAKVWRRWFNNALRQLADETVRQALVGHAGEQVGVRHYSRASEDEMRAAAGSVVRLVTGGE